MTLSLGLGLGLGLSGDNSEPRVQNLVAISYVEEKLPELNALVDGIAKELYANQETDIEAKTPPLEDIKAMTITNIDSADLTTLIPDTAGGDVLNVDAYDKKIADLIIQKSDAYDVVYNKISEKYDDISSKIVDLQVSKAILETMKGETSKLKTLLNAKVKEARYYTGEIKDLESQLLSEFTEAMIKNTIERKTKDFINNSNIDNLKVFVKNSLTSLMDMNKATSLNSDKIIARDIKQDQRTTVKFDGDFADPKTVCRPNPAGGMLCDVVFTQRSKAAPAIARDLFKKAAVKAAKVSLDSVIKASGEATLKEFIRLLNAQ